MPTCGRRREPSGASWGHLSRPGQEDDDAWRHQTAGRKCLVAAGFRVEPPIGIEPMTYALRGALLPRSHSVTCTDSTTDRTRSADCTGISRRPVPRSAMAACHLFVRIWPGQPGSTAPGRPSRLRSMGLKPKGEPVSASTDWSTVPNGCAEAELKRLRRGRGPPWHAFTTRPGDDAPVPRGARQAGNGVEWLPAMRLGRSSADELLLDNPPEVLAR